MPVIDKSDELFVNWNSTPCVEYYTVQYKLTNFDQCDQQTRPEIPFWEGSDTSIVINGLEAFSTYEVSVFSINYLGYGGISKQFGITSVSGN